MAQLENGNQLLEAFGDIVGAGYSTPVMLTDTKVGFSVQKQYPNDIRFKPAKTATGEDDDIAVIWVVYEAGKQKANANLVPIRLRIANMSKYRAKNWDFDFNDKDSPTEESVIASKRSPQPLDLNLVDAYSYDVTANVLVDDKGNTVRGIEVLNAMFNYHCNTVHPIKGLGIRSKHLAHNILKSSLGGTISACVWVLKNIFGRTLDERRDRITYTDGYLKEDFKKISVDSIEVAGYRASKKVILLFALIVSIAAYIILPVDDDSYMGNLLGSELLMAVHFILLLYLLDEAIPNIIFSLMNFVISLRKCYIFSLLKG